MGASGSKLETIEQLKKYRKQFMELADNIQAKSPNSGIPQNIRQNIQSIQGKLQEELLLEKQIEDLESQVKEIKERIKIIDSEQAEILYSLASKKFNFMNKLKYNNSISNRFEILQKRTRFLKRRQNAYQKSIQRMARK